MACVVAVAVATLVGWASVRSTRLALRSDGVYFEPDPRISTPIALVLIGALAFKAVELAQAIESARGAGGGWIDAIGGVVEPITPIVIAFAATYVGVYDWGIFRRSWKASGGLRSITRSRSRG